MAASKRHVSPIKTVSLPILLVGVSTPALARKEALLRQAGFEVTAAENVCYAELFSETRFFEAAVYDESLRAEEQVSLARVMRVRWPWMRLIRCGHEALLLAEEELFDFVAFSEAELPTLVLQSLRM